MSSTPFDQFQKDIPMKQIVQVKSEVNETFKVKYAKRTHFDATIPDEWKDSLLNHCHGNLRSKAYEKLKASHEGKLRLLIDRSGWVVYTCKPGFCDHFSR